MYTAVPRYTQLYTIKHNCTPESCTQLSPGRDVSLGYKGLCALVEASSAHCTVHTVQCTLYSLACTVHTVHCTLHTAHSTLHTAHSTPYTLHCTLHTAHCTLHTPHCTIHTAHCTLYSLVSPSRDCLPYHI